MLLTASLAGFRPRRLVVLALAVAFAYNLVPYALLVPSRLDNNTQQASFWRPAIGFLRTHDQPGYRVEVVPTAEHWEAYWIPKVGLPARARLVPAARHRRQPRALLEASRRRGVPPAGCARTPSGTSSSARPRRSTGTAGRRRRASLRSPSSGLKVVFRSRNWTIYELPHATPLLTGPANPVVTSFGHTVIRGRVFAAGRYLLRAHYSPYLRLQGGGCVVAGARQDDVPRPDASPSDSRSASRGRRTGSSGSSSAAKKRPAAPSPS